MSLALKSLTNQMPYPPANLLDDLAIAISPSAAFSLRTEPEVITLAPKGSANFKVIVTRQKDFNEQITLAIGNINDGGPKPVPSLPPNVTAALKPIPANQQEIEITLTATDKAPQGEFTLSLEGSLKKGKQTIKQPISLSLKLQPKPK